MEKRKPSHDIERFRAVCGNVATLDITETAILSARTLGFEIEDVAALVQTITPRMFYKSMTSFRDHRIWQDVYHVPTDLGFVVYLKFTNNIVTEFTILSFKEQ